MLRVLTIALCACLVRAAYVGESCVKGGQPGTCLLTKNCPSAIDDIRNRRQPQSCGFVNRDQIVCCVGNGEPRPTTSAPPVATTAKQPKRTTTERYEPPVYEYTDNRGSVGDCAPIDPSLTSPKTGRKAWDKCLEYQEKLIYPCETAVALTGEKVRGKYCGHVADELIVGGVDAAKREFPHMALVGLGDLPNVQWLCGGAVISERFVLTAGHCLSSRDAGNVSYVIVGALRRSDTDNNRRYKIKAVHRHPLYDPPRKFYDIALLEMEKEMKLDQFVVPACLHVGEVQDDRASASGWGLTQYGGSVADTLQKVVLTKFNQDECYQKYPHHRLMPGGFNSTTQICYGDRTKSKDTCQGDSGGPLQIKSKKINCMYVLIGVTSFGKACGFIGDPGIYTRVSAFVPWIESVVWP